MADYHNSGSSTSNPASGENGSSAPSTNGTAQPYSPAFQSHAGHSSHAPETDGLIQILSRQWHVIVLTTIVALLLGIGYLLVTKPTYTATSELKVLPLDASAISTTSGDNSGQLDPDFLDTECEVIKSTAVLALALDKIRDTRTLTGVALPLEFLKDKITAEQSKKGHLIEVSFDAHSTDDAKAIVNAVVDSYKEYNANAWSQRAQSFSTLFQQGKDEKTAEMSKIQQDMLDLANKEGFTPDLDPSKDPAHEEVQNLREAEMKAKLETITARNAYDEAAKSIIGDPAKVRAVDDAEQRSTGASTDPQAQLKTIQDELFLEQAKLDDAQRQYLAAHPIVKTIQRRIDQLTVSAVVAAKDWEQASLAREESLDKSLSEAERAELELSKSQQQYARLSQELENIKTSNSAVSESMSKIDLSKGAGALNVSVLNPAEISPEVKPPAKKTLGIALVVGLIVGLGIACLRDWTDDRLRTPHAIRETTGAPMLGAIPAITSAYTTADRGQIVHHDPFGDAAESYRTLRTALQFGLPTGTKTLLITSPMAGDGKSTVISNLAIAMAQAGKRILIMDCDFRAPMQHRLFNLNDMIGLATVLGGTDTIAQAIQHTEIQNLDVLPCGPIPSNPAEMLNDPTFVEHLNDLADKYDLVLLDSPPVTVVADARILAASVDVSMLVVRPQSSTRKQTEAARDGLRSVGGRLIGVTVNAVQKNGAFGGASGYYPRAETGLEFASRSSASDRVKQVPIQ